MIFDTCFLVDLHRESRRGVHGSAQAFLEAHLDVPARLSVITAGEFAEGFSPDQRALCADILHLYAILDITEAVAWTYAALSRELRRRGDRIGDHDLWIAATALTHHEPLVTRNVHDFHRIPRLHVLVY